MAQEADRGRPDGEQSRALQSLRQWMTACETHHWEGERSAYPAIAIRQAKLGLFGLGMSEQHQSHGGGIDFPILAV